MVLFLLPSRPLPLLPTYYPSPVGSYNELQTNRLYIGNRGVDPDTNPGNAENTDLIQLSRVNVASNSTELRLIIGDDANASSTAVDKFIIGARDGTVAGAPWVPRVTVLSRGQVSIGSTDPQAMLDVRGSIRFTDQKACYITADLLEEGAQYRSMIVLGTIVPATWRVRDCARYAYDVCPSSIKSTQYCEFKLACFGANGEHSWTTARQASNYVNTNLGGNSFTWFTGGYLTSPGNFCDW